MSESMMHIKVVKRYNDLALKKIQEVGTELDVTEKRGKYLISQGMAMECEKTVEKGGKKKDEKQNIGEQRQDSDESAAVR